MDRLAQLGSDIVKLWGNYGPTYLNGMWSTIWLAVVCTFIGCLIGFLCGVLQTIPCEKNDHIVKRFFIGLLRLVIRIYVEVFRGTPMILQAVFVYFGLPYFTKDAIRFTSPILAALVVVSINTGAYMAETVRGGILSVDPGQTEGAKAIGMRHFQTMLSVILPQALRSIMPQIGNNLIINIKDTSVMFIISYTEFFAVHRGVSGATYMYFPSAAIEMAGYLLMTLSCSVLLRWMEKKMDGADSYDLATTDTLAHTSGTLNFRKRRALSAARHKAVPRDAGKPDRGRDERGR
ncbi:MAG: amino acid ABC transporter permease [Oscillospiraceae bacterium]|jgi:putative lysine transport system permease protein|nr:amino acid ABC transporter permease [Oscillospiraceae bacterium]